MSGERGGRCSAPSRLRDVRRSRSPDGAGVRAGRAFVRPCCGGGGGPGSEWGPGAGQVRLGRSRRTPSTPRVPAAIPRHVVSTQPGTALMDPQPLTRRHARPGRGPFSRLDRRNREPAAAGRGDLVRLHERIAGSAGPTVAARPVSVLSGAEDQGSGVGVEACRGGVPGLLNATEESGKGGEHGLDSFDSALFSVVCCPPAGSGLGHVGVSSLVARPSGARGG
jgi:hypothetical protein